MIAKYLFKMRAFYWIRDQSSTWPDSIVLCIHIQVSSERSCHLGVAEGARESSPDMQKQYLEIYCFGGAQDDWGRHYSFRLNNLSRLPMRCKDCWKCIKSVLYLTSYVLSPNTIEFMKSRPQNRKMDNVFLWSSIVHKIFHSEVNSSFLATSSLFILSYGF